MKPNEDDKVAAASFFLDEEPDCLEHDRGCKEEQIRLAQALADARERGREEIQDDICAREWFIRVMKEAQAAIAQAEGTPPGTFASVAECTWFHAAKNAGMAEERAWWIQTLAEDRLMMQTHAAIEKRQQEQPTS